MIIPVSGMDPSLTHWGIADATLDLKDGFLEVLNLKIVEPEEIKGKQVRVNSNDLARSEQLAKAAIESAKLAKVTFVEVPVGSQSARAMASYGVCVGVVGTLRALDHHVIEVQAGDVKKALTGNKNATKKQMIEAAMKLYPEANWPTYVRKGQTLVADKAEHVADALGAIHAGVLTPEFQTFMRLFKE